MAVFLGESIEGKKTKKGICGIDRMMTWFEIAQPSVLSHLKSSTRQGTFKTLATKDVGAVRRGISKYVI